MGRVNVFTGPWNKFCVALSALCLIIGIVFCNKQRLLLTILFIVQLVILRIRLCLVKKCALLLILHWIICRIIRLLGLRTLLGCVAKCKMRLLVIFNGLQMQWRPKWTGIVVSWSLKWMILCGCGLITCPTGLEVGSLLHVGLGLLRSLNFLGKLLLGWSCLGTLNFILFFTSPSWNHIMADLLLQGRPLSIVWKMLRMLSTRLKLSYKWDSVRMLQNILLNGRGSLIWKLRGNLSII